MNEIKKIHPFEESGLGLAPFSYIGMEEIVIRHPDGHTQAGGSCDHCGAGIRYAFWIKSSDGKRFKVGSDCVRKLDRVDNRLLSEVEREIAKFEKAKRDAKRQAKWDAARAKTEALNQAERDANGGKTLYEIEQEKRAAEAKELAVKMYAVNGWLIKVLESLPYASEFVDGMVAKLESQEIDKFSERQLSILVDIYAKSKARRGSKKYDAAVEDFYRLAGIQEPVESAEIE